VPGAYYNARYAQAYRSPHALTTLLLRAALRPDTTNDRCGHSQA